MTKTKNDSKKVSSKLASSKPVSGKRGSRERGSRKLWVAMAGEGVLTMAVDTSEGEKEYVCAFSTKAKLKDFADIGGFDNIPVEGESLEEGECLQLVTMAEGLFLMLDPVLDSDGQLEYDEVVVQRE